MYNKLKNLEIYNKEDEEEFNLWYVKDPITGEERFIYADNAPIDYPEDLTWERDISAVFDLGVEMGIKLCKRTHLDKQK